jgi:hypothetical protein
MLTTIPEQITQLADELESSNTFQESTKESQFYQMFNLFTKVLEVNGKEIIEDNAVASQRINKYAIDALINFNENSTGMSTHSNNATNLMATLQQIYPKDSWKQVRCGILAETAVNISLKNLGFKVTPPSYEDDLKGKVDCWADCKDGTVLAVQIKSSAYIDKPSLTIIKRGKDGKISISDEYSKKTESMLEYISNRAFDGRIIPVFIEIPGGLNNEFSGFNEITGAPSADLPNNLYNLINKRIFTKEYGYGD